MHFKKVILALSGLLIGASYSLPEVRANNSRPLNPALLFLDVLTWQNEKLLQDEECNILSSKIQTNEKAALESSEYKALLQSEAFKEFCKLFWEYMERCFPTHDHQLCKNLKDNLDKATVTAQETSEWKEFFESSVYGNWQESKNKYRNQGCE